jgi:hypothetical protein
MYDGAAMRFRALRYCAVGAAIALPVLAQVVLLWRTISARFACPIDLEYLEGAHIYHAWRLAHGLPLYDDPAHGFATFPYPPLFWIAIRGAAYAFGFTDEAGRAVSVLSLLGTAAILGTIVVAASAKRAQGVAMAGLSVAGICAGYGYCGGSYDLARPDTMGMFLAIAGAAAVGAEPPTLWRLLLAGALMTASIYTKQTGVMFAPWVVLFVFWRQRRAGIVLAAVTGVLCALALLALQTTTNGWFLRWISYPSRHPFFPDRSWGALWLLIKHAPFLPLLPACAVLLQRRGALRPVTVLWSGMLVVGVAASVLAGIKDLAWLNVWIPGLLLSWPTAMLLLGDVLRATGGRVASERASLVMAAAGAVLVTNLYRMGPFVPDADRWVAAARLNDVLRPLGGDVVVTTAPMVAVDAGSKIPQPILATYEDAKDGGMQVDYVDALVASGARWVVTTDRCTKGKYAGVRSIEAQMARAFVRVKTYPFDVHGLEQWDTPTNVSLWQRVQYAREDDSAFPRDSGEVTDRASSKRSVAASGRFGPQRRGLWNPPCTGQRVCAAPSECQPGETGEPPSHVRPLAG